LAFERKFCYKTPSWAILLPFAAKHRPIIMMMSPSKPYERIRPKGVSKSASLFASFMFGALMATTFVSLLRPFLPPKSRPCPGVPRPRISQDQPQSTSLSLSSCTDSFSPLWEAYKQSCPSHAPLCLVGADARTCKSLLPNALFQDCPSDASLSACFKLHPQPLVGPTSNRTMSHKGELSVIILVDGRGGGGGLGATLAALLAQTSFSIQGILFALLDGSEDLHHCVELLTDVVIGLGLNVHTCYAHGQDSCLSLLQEDLAARKGPRLAPKVMILHESVMIGCKSLSLLLGVSKYLTNSLILPSIFSTSGSLLFGQATLQDTSNQKTDLETHNEKLSISVYPLNKLPFAVIVGIRKEVVALVVDILSLSKKFYLGRTIMTEKRGHQFLLLDHAIALVNQEVLPSLSWPSFDPQDRRKLLYIDTNIPTPDKDSGSKRTFALMTILIDEGMDVSFQPLWPFEDKYRAQLEAIGVEVLPSGYSDTWTVEAGGRRQEYAIIVIARRFPFEYSQAKVKSTWPNAKLVYDTVDLHFLREARVKMTDAMTLDGTTDLDAHTSTSKVIQWFSVGGEGKQEVNRVRELELSFVSASDLTLVVSEAEVQVIKHYLPRAKVALVSNIMSGRESVGEEEEEEEEDVRATRIQFEERSGFLFVGHMVHFPNQQAVRALVETIIPQVKQRVHSGGWGRRYSDHDGHQLLALPLFHLVGSGKLPDDLQAAVEREKAIVYHGELSDPQLGFLYSSVKAAMAPLVTGAGVKGKVNQAMSLGVPVVATSVAVEGMHVKPGVDCMVAGSLGDFVNHLERVCNDFELWRSLSVNGKTNVRRFFSMDVARKVVREVLKDLMD
jgi:glycosyltransferase involved in cell wall biosynthesis